MPAMSSTKRHLAIAACGLMVLSAAPVLAGPMSTDGVVLQKKSERSRSAQQENEHEHRQRCWVSRDNFRNFGYFKC